MCQPRFSEWLTYTQGGVLSPDGKCKPFDVTANGCVVLLYHIGDILITAHHRSAPIHRFGRGEGIVVIVLKPLEAALRDHDHVYATVGLVLWLPSVRVCNS